MLYFIYFVYVSKYVFLYVLIFLLLITGDWTKMEGGGMRRGRGSNTTRTTEDEV
jgi:hypothetical protein